MRVSFNVRVWRGVRWLYKSTFLTLFSSICSTCYRDSFPKDRAVELKELLLDITGKCIASGRSKVILRKLFVAVSPSHLEQLHTSFCGFLLYYIKRAH